MLFRTVPEVTVWDAVSSFFHVTTLPAVIRATSGVKNSSLVGTHAPFTIDTLVTRALAAREFGAV